MNDDGWITKLRHRAHCCLAFMVPFGVDIEPGSRWNCPDPECGQPWQFVWESGRAACYPRPMTVDEQVAERATQTAVLDADAWLDICALGRG